MPGSGTLTARPLRGVRPAFAVMALLAVTLTAPPPAAADSPLEDAVRELSSGGFVHASDGAPEVSEETLALARARLAEADTPVRGALLDGVDATGAAHTLAEEVGAPGLYVVVTEERGSTGDTTTTWSWTQVGADTGSADLEHHFTFAPGDPAEKLAGVVDLLDGDLLPGVAAAAREETVHVHPAVRAALPDLDVEAVAERFAGLEGTRVAVVPPPAEGTSGFEEAYADALLEPLDDDGTALLAVWAYGGFRLTAASGPDGPPPEDLSRLLSSSPGTGELATELGTFAGAVDGGVVADARAALAEDHLYVHPRSGADVSEADRAELDAALASRDEPVRVAVLPVGAELEAGPDGASGLADAVADGTGPVVVYTLDGSGAVRDYPVRGTVTGGDHDLDTAAFFGLDRESARASVDGLLEQLGDGAVLDTGAADTPPAPTGSGSWLPGAAVLGLLVSAALTTMGVIGSRGRRRALAARERERLAAEREEAETMAELRAEEEARVVAIQAENDRGITELGEALAHAQAPVVDSVAEFETHLREYERLKEDNGRADDIDRVLAVRRRTEQAHDRLRRWNRRQRGH
ncbi:hypothetical protein [Nocardiopsis sp. NPDC006938]|uniref:hypothetical protein n=1 Tax=Nocardiopsis sp. NPDC006938 TaxID=3364337 RepID=UPI00368B800E